MRRWGRRVCCSCGLALVLAACASGPVGALRFENREPVWRVDDRRPIPKPEPREDLRVSRELHQLMRLSPLEALAFPEPRRAMNINSLGEVPDSTWFTNRIGMHSLSPQQLAQGPGRDVPDRSGPWTVLRGTGLGSGYSMVIEDARGQRYLLKPDPRQRAEMASGAEVVTQRLLWAAGYNVPQNEVVRFGRDQLEISPEATRKRRTGEQIRLTEQQLERRLRDVTRTADGSRFRASVSRFVEGEPIGGYPMQGVREDDPNDRVPHEHRRDLRGQRAFFGWLGHADVKEDNTLDAWVPDEAGSTRGHVIHYLIDFDKALGGKGIEIPGPAMGRAHTFDYYYAGTSLLAFGLWKRPWEDMKEVPLRGVGRYDVDSYEPRLYRPSWPHPPFLHADRFDGYWAAKIIARFRRDHVAAAVRQARYTQERTRRYLVDTIVARARETCRHWFSEVNPVDRFRVEEEAGGGWRVCGEDLLLAHDLADVVDDTRYEARAYDYDGTALRWRRIFEATPSGTFCLEGPRLPRHDDGYTMIRFVTWRGQRRLPASVVHLARHEDSGRLRVIGTHRR